jgi:Kef-type K+ transport system membrane component KefB
LRGAAAAALFGNARLRRSVERSCEDQRGGREAIVATDHSMAIFVAELILLLFVGRMLGEMLSRFGQPAIFGQLLAGVLLGPSVFGALFPDLWHLIFPGTPTIKSMIDAISQIGILLLLLLTGMEANLSLVNRRRRAVISTSVLGIAVPFAFGVALTYALPAALLLSEMLTASAMQHYQAEIEKAVVLALFIPLIMSSGGNSGSQATSLIIRALALHEVTLRDWWRIASRELPASLTLGALLGIIGILRIVLWQTLGIFDYGPHWPLVALTVGLALVAIVTFGSMMGSMLPFVLKSFKLDPATASAPFVATLVDVTGLIIYFSVAYVVLAGSLL